MTQQPGHIREAKHLVEQQQVDLETMVGDRLDAMLDDELLAALQRHNEFAARLFERGGRERVPRVTLLSAVYSS